MAIPAVPRNLEIQQAGGNVLLTWDITTGATSYAIERSTDGVTFSALSTSAVNLYQDTSGTVGTLYYYKVASVNADGTSSYSSAVSITPSNTGDLSLGEVRLMSQQRADRVNSNFVTKAEWNNNIRQSYFELYDLLVTVYEDYFSELYTFTTDGTTNRYSLPTDFYKLLGVDCGVGPSANAYVSVKKFDFIARNSYVYPNITSSYLGVFNLQYRLNGDKIMFIPTPSAGQSIRLWYIVKRAEPLLDTDILSGISGWTEYVITDAAIKALQKEESDVSVLMAQKMALKQRIEESAMNRDVGQADTISNTRSISESINGGPGWDGPWGG